MSPPPILPTRASAAAEPAPKDIRSCYVRLATQGLHLVICIAVAVVDLSGGGGGEDGEGDDQCKVVTELRALLYIYAFRTLAILALTAVYIRSLGGWNSGEEGGTSAGVEGGGESPLPVVVVPPGVGVADSGGAVGAGHAVHPFEVASAGSEPPVRQSVGGEGSAKSASPRSYAGAVFCGRGRKWTSISIVLFATHTCLLVFGIATLWEGGWRECSQGEPLLYWAAVINLAFFWIVLAAAVALYVALLPWVLFCIGLDWCSVYLSAKDWRDYIGEEDVLAAEHMIRALPKDWFRAREGGGGMTGGAELSPEDAQCSICLLPYEHMQGVMKLPCEHRFHVQCVEEWLRVDTSNMTCPLCKYVVFESDARARREQAEAAEAAADEHDAQERGERELDP